MTTRAMRSAGYHTTSRVRCAARYAALTGCSIHEAAQVFAVNAGGVWNAWDRIYPDVPQPTSDRKRPGMCSACGATGHLAVRGRCSPSELALRMVRGGTTVAKAADRLGLTTGAVYAARDQRRRAA